jgi:hypothetical protein
MSKKIGLLDVDYKHGKNFYNKVNIFPNLALMKISSYYKQKGYEVEWYSPLFHKSYDKIFASKVFTYKAPKESYLKKDMIIGGSGINMHKKLPEKIEHIYPDYDLYGVDYAMGFLTRGCIRECEFCIVREKEGLIRKHSPLEQFWDGQDKIKLLDNNILAYNGHLELLEELIDSEAKIDFNQGLDIRLISEKNAELLSKVRIWKRYTFAFDNMGMRDLIEKKLTILNNAGIKNSRIRFFVLIGFNTTKEEDISRLKFLREKEIRPYVMLYRRNEKYLKDLRDWANFKPHFFTYEWEEYEKNKKTIKNGTYSKKQIKRKHRLPEDQIQLENYLEG